MVGSRERSPTVTEQDAEPGPQHPLFAQPAPEKTNRARSVHGMMGSALPPALLPSQPTSCQGKSSVRVLTCQRVWGLLPCRKPGSRRGDLRDAGRVWGCCPRSGGGGEQL